MEPVQAHLLLGDQDEILQLVLARPRSMASLMALSSMPDAGARLRFEIGWVQLVNQLGLVVLPHQPLDEREVLQ